MYLKTIVWKIFLKDTSCCYERTCLKIRRRNVHWLIRIWKPWVSAPFATYELTRYVLKLWHKPLNSIIFDNTIILYRIFFSTREFIQKFLWHFLKGESIRSKTSVQIIEREILFYMPYNGTACHSIFRLSGNTAPCIVNHFFNRCYLFPFKLRLICRRDISLVVI